MILHLCPFELEIKMVDEDEIFRKFRRKTPEWMADFESLFQPLISNFQARRMMVDQLQRWKHRVQARWHFPHNVTRNLWKAFKAFFSRITNLLLTKLARDRTGRISVLGPIYSQYGPRAWLIRYIYNMLHKTFSLTYIKRKIFPEVFITCFKVRKYFSVRRET